MSPYDDEEPYDEQEQSMEEVKTVEGDVVVTLSSQALQSMATAVQYAVIERLTVATEKAVQKQLSALVDEAVRKVIGDKAEELVLAELTKPRQKFNEWGVPTGPTITFAEQIPFVIEQWMNQMVDTKGQVGFHSSDRKATRVGWIIGQHIQSQIDPAVQNAVSSVTKQARDIVTAKVSAFVAEQMMPSIDVKTLGVRS